MVAIGLMIQWMQSCTKDPIENPDTDSDIELNESADTILLNVQYGSHAQQVYDIFLPRQRNQNTPILIMIHGGAWKAGRKEDLNQYRDIIRANWGNIAIVNMNYRLASNSDHIHHNEIMQDIDRVIQHVLSHQKTYNISSKMGIMGGSAGGQLSMIYAYKYNKNIKCVGNFFGPSIISDWEWYNSTNIWLGGKVGNILAEYVGQTWDKEVYDAVSPYWNVNSSTQPTISFQGVLDPIVPPNQNKLLHEKLDIQGVENEYYEYFAFHGFDANQSRDALLKMIGFFQKHIK
ncbi:MAG: esterase/lipase [Bacteroidetes bacterium OLB9]|nr:MAG: esterase/lipase [Bacteroidetes bacterium OLB9]